MRPPPCSTSRISDSAVTDFPLPDEAERYYKSGQLPFLHRMLPFWLATLIDRTLVLIIPLIAILIPLTRIVPGLYSWRVRSKVYRWYGELAFLEAQLRQDAGPEARRSDRGSGADRNR